MVAIKNRNWLYSHSIGRQTAEHNESVFGRTGGFCYPVGIAPSKDGFLYVLSRGFGYKEDLGHEGLVDAYMRISKVTVDEDHVGDIARNQFTWPSSIAVSKNGLLFCSDEHENVIKIFPNDTITPFPEVNFNADHITKWGISGSENGHLNGPSGICFDKYDNLLVVDSNNNRVQIFTDKGVFINSWGKIGNNKGEFNKPWGIVCDNNEDVYIADWGNNRVQKFSSKGEHILNFGVSNNHAHSLNHPAGVAVDSEGFVYVTDWGNKRVQIYSSDGSFVSSLGGDIESINSKAEHYVWWRIVGNIQGDSPETRDLLKQTQLETKKYHCNFFAPTGIAVDQNDNIIIADDPGRLIIYKKTKLSASMKSDLYKSVSHLMRRASFGASHELLEKLCAQSYEETVEQLLEPESQPDYDELTFFRYHPMAQTLYVPRHAQLNWLYRMTNSQRYLQEKMALFWHQIFATGISKVNRDAMHAQIDMFRNNGMGNYKTLLIELAKDPAMIFWLDNQENHKDEPNENWGRELLELFSLGVGHYTEKDVFECARAFTGWSFINEYEGIPSPPVPREFQYYEDDHDNGEKTFLGHTGTFNGEDIIDIILKQPACATFITRHLYNFFVADEPEVPKWPNEPPRDSEAIEYLSKVFVESDYEIKPVLRALFNSDFFKEATYQKVKSPVEVVVGTLKLTEHLGGPDPEWSLIIKEPNSMGQDLLDPPTVEGWHTGKEWINSGAFINRVNFVADKLKNAELPGVKIIIENVKQSSTSDSPESIVDACLEELGDLKLETDTYNELIADINFVDGSNGNGNIDHQIANTLSMIAGTVEYQFC